MLERHFKIEKIIMKPTYPIGQLSKVVFLITITCLLAGCGKSYKGQKWEYDTLAVLRVARQWDGTSTTEFAKILNERGAEGWEVVGTDFDGSDNYNMVVIFKRPLK